MEFMKKHKNICSLIVVIILVIITAIYTKTILNNTEKEAIYGSRTKAIENVKISSKTMDNIKKVYSDIKDEDVSVELQGRIIEVMVTVKDGIKDDTARDKTKEIIKILSNKERKVYDVQVFIKKKGKDSTFPIIGYLHHGKENFSWTRDR